METDRAETNNLVRANHDVVSRLSVAFFNWAKNVGSVGFSTIESREPQSMKDFRKSKVQDIVSPGEFGLQ